MAGVVREAACADVAAIARVHVDSWRTSYRGIVPDTVLDGLSYERREPMWRGLLCGDPGPHFTYVAQVGGLVVGIAHATTEPQDARGYEGELGIIYLLAEHQRRGLGRALVASVAARFTQLGTRSMLLWVFEANQPARRFYEALGGVIAGEQTFELGGESLTEVAYGWPDVAALSAALDEPMGSRSG